MNTFRKGLTICLAALGLAFGSAVGASGEEKPLSPQAQSLKQLLSSLKEHPEDKSIQSQYLLAFPKDIKTFRNLFDQSDFSELYYDEADYVGMLSSLAERHPETVGKLLIGLCKNATAGPDALSDLQQATIEYATSRTSLFAKLMKARPAKEASGVIRFLADVENHEAYPEYSQLIANLRKGNETTLARQFESARTERKRQKGHGELRDEPSYSGGT
jgi:hypothetical protein